jgi:FMN phosphatase YigB (HAD superfamily)
VPPPLRTVVFDLGGVLADWDPRYLYRELFDGDEPAMEQISFRSRSSSGVIETMLE